jgi:hypothetical protein
VLGLPNTLNNSEQVFLETIDHVPIAIGLTKLASQQATIQDNFYNKRMPDLVAEKILYASL